MAVRLRLKRTGKKKQPSYRVVAVDSRKPRDGRVLEIIGTYDPRQEPSAISIANERAVHWLSHGAQPSDTVSKLLMELPDELPATVGLHSAPSKSADIGQTVVTGVHGPGRCIAVLV